MRVAIHQPNYLPWLGYFAKIRCSDLFIFLDDVSIPTGRSFVSRVKINSYQGPQWLTVPILRVCGQMIMDVEIADLGFAQKHLRTLQMNYGRTPFYVEIIGLLTPVLLSKFNKLSQLNIALIETICRYLGMSPQFMRSSELRVQSRSDDRLIEIVRAVGGDAYISGQGGTNYQDPAKFSRAGITLSVKSYSPIPYSQIHSSTFVPGLSIVDALFHLGRNTVRLLDYQS